MNLIYAISVYHCMIILFVFKIIISLIAIMNNNTISIVDISEKSQIQKSVLFEDYQLSW